ncbi:MAG: WD40/YVTN/BNR-like repeat-containing protein [Thermomicrobiales bacterium]
MSDTRIATDRLHALEWRLIGPFRGGRVVAVAGDPARDQVFYMGSTGGGVWKTTDGGMFWENISDGYFKRASVGAIAVSESDPNVIYVGMGEVSIRGNVAHGDGVYKSTDAGKTWTHCGLADTRHIAKIRVHPKNPDLIYVAALGHAHGPNTERGVYRSKDGGTTWEQVLFRSEVAGASDLVMDPHNPRVLYVSFWEARREAHQLVSGGAGSGIFKSTDGGDTWAEITRNSGLPKGVLGNIGLAASPARRDRVWALIEAEDGAVFRSDDGGAHWERLSEDRNLRQRAWYYMHIYAHPTNPETLWVLNVPAFVSTDGGKTFGPFPIPHGDNHDLWIDPKNPNRMIQGNDGGAAVSFTGGATWSTLYNQPTAEFYHVTTDTQVPYGVYGAQQDNTTIAGPSRSAIAGIPQSEWFEVGGGESGYIAVRPDDASIVYAGSYGGSITRFDRRTGQRRTINVWPEAHLGWGAKDVRYRFNWTSPIMLSPHDQNVLYITGNHVFRSTDEGSSWEAISPDLTRNDVTKQEASGGPITKDNTGAEYYCTIFAFAESPVQRGALWAGSDDGLVHVSRDNGASWENVTPNDLPEWALISIIEASPHDPATAYIAATRYKHDDFRPYLYKTNDYGAHWTKITDGIAENDFTRVIREDPARRGLLYAGTETGVQGSFDDGGRWQPLQRNLPVVPIHDLVVKDSDLIAATHGRAFWVLDDLTPLREMTNETATATVHLFPPRPTIRYITNRGFFRQATPGKNYQMTGATILTKVQEKKADGAVIERYLDAGSNPPDGVLVTYYLNETPDKSVTLTFLDSEGNEIKSFKSDEKKPDAEDQKEKAKGERSKTEPQSSVLSPQSLLPGINRFIWDMRYPEAEGIDGFFTAEGTLPGPLASPGTYQVRLTVGDEAQTQSFVIAKDPRVSATQADLDAQFDLLCRIREKINETHATIKTLRAVRAQAEEWEKRAQGEKVNPAIAEHIATLKERLAPIEEELIQTQAKVRSDTLNFPVKLNSKLASVYGAVAGADAAPTKQMTDVFTSLADRTDTHRSTVNQIVDGEVAALNTMIRDAHIPAIVPRDAGKG